MLVAPLSNLTQPLRELTLADRLWPFRAPSTKLFAAAGPTTPEIVADVRPRANLMRVCAETVKQPVPNTKNPIEIKNILVFIASPPGVSRVRPFWHPFENPVSQADFIPILRLVQVKRTADKRRTARPQENYCFFS